MKGLSNLLLSTCKIGRIVAPYFFWIATIWNKPSKGLDKGVGLQRTYILDVDRTTCKTGEKAPIHFLRASPKGVYTGVSEGWLKRNDTTAPPALYIVGGQLSSLCSSLKYTDS